TRPTRPGRRKPVVYAHLLDANPDFTFDLEVTVGAGAILEHWPATEVEGATVRWEDVALSRESCAGGPYPSADDPACANAPDGYCELAELSAYAADDAGCLTVGGEQEAFLFYRGGGASPALPVTVARADDGTILLTNEALEPVGPVLRLSRTDDGIRVAQVAMPAAGERATIPAADAEPTDAHREVIRTQLRELGLTAGEAGAFERAWFGELFDAEAPTPHAFADALLFFLPPGAIDAFARLEAEPQPAEVKRAMAVRLGWTE
ncbi:MAG TPA: hypothetical protein RMI62_10445, partial [Polyangiaceae bacterium LLY-WYZ-15_(1-7)]|nr:hypothetical protein [Polyangiaceae bacterium LLY-WYZ-15_(1-7)]